MANIGGTEPRPAAPRAVPGAVPTATTGYVDWGAILAGAVVASAIAFILTAFGAALGLSLLSPFEGMGIGSTGLLIAIGIWTVWVAASANMAGGYLTGRLRQRVHDATEHESDVRDGSHGLVMWGVSVLITALLLASGAATTARVGAEAVGAAGSAAGQAAGAAAEAAPDLGYLADSLLRPSPQDPGVVPSGPAGAQQPAQQAGGGDASGEVVRIFENLGDGEMNSEDRQYLASLVAERTGLTQDEAERRIDESIERLRTMEQEIQEAADAARKLSIVAAFLLAASLLIGGAGAWYAAQFGGQHRDDETVFPLFGRRR